MNFKLIGSFLLLALGTYFILHGLTLSPPVEVPKDFWEKTSDFFSNNTMWNPLIEFFGGTPIEEPPKYSSNSIINMSVGGFLILAGGVLAFLCCKRTFKK